MITSPVFRHAKPGAAELFSLVGGATVDFTEQVFTDSIEMEETNYALFDVIRSDGVTLNREQGLFPDYWFENGSLRTKEPGTYTLRVYSSIMPFEQWVINLGKKMVPSDGSLFKVGVPFWPQILSQPEHGIARVSNDGRHIAYVSRGFIGQVAFSYRLVNAFGQVSEPACVNITTTR